jgi:hypothetical protein
MVSRLAMFLTGLTAMGIFNITTPAATVKIDVDFRLTKFESDEGITNREIRVLVGRCKDWQSPEAGHKFVTDSNGGARFTVEAAMERRWISVPVAMTGISIPKHADHLWVAAELEQFIQLPQSPLQRYPGLYCFDIDNVTDDTSSTTGITAIYARDAKGWFSVKRDFVPGPNGHLKVP